MTCCCSAAIGTIRVEVAVSRFVASRRWTYPCCAGLVTHKCVDHDHDRCFDVHTCTTAQHKLLLAWPEAVTPSGCNTKKAMVGRTPKQRVVRLGPTDLGLTDQACRYQPDHVRQTSPACRESRRRRRARVAENQLVPRPRPQAPHQGPGMQPPADAAPVRPRPRPLAAKFGPQARAAPARVEKPPPEQRHYQTGRPPSCGVLRGAWRVRLWHECGRCDRTPVMGRGRPNQTARRLTPPGRPPLPADRVFPLKYRVAMLFGAAGVRQRRVEASYDGVNSSCCTSARCQGCTSLGGRREPLGPHGLDAAAEQVACGQVRSV